MVRTFPLSSCRMLNTLFFHSAAGPPSSMPRYPCKTRREQRNKLPGQRRGCSNMWSISSEVHGPTHLTHDGSNIRQEIDGDVQTSPSREQISPRSPGRIGEASRGAKVGCHGGRRPRLESRPLDFGEKCSFGVVTLHVSPLSPPCGPVRHSVLGDKSNSFRRLNAWSILCREFLDRRA